MGLKMNTHKPRINKFNYVFHQKIIIGYIVEKFTSHQLPSLCVKSLNLVGFLLTNFKNGESLLAWSDPPMNIVSCGSLQQGLISYFCFFFNLIM